MILNEMNGAASVEDILTLTLEALRDAKARMRPETTGDPEPWWQQALLGPAQWDTDALRDVVRDHVVDRAIYGIWTKSGL